MALLNIKKPGVMKSAIPTVHCKDYLPILGGSVSMLIANGGTGKSFCSIKIAMKFVDEDPRRKAVLWLTEDGEGETFNRYQRLVQDFGNEQEFFDERIRFIASRPHRFTKMEDGNAVLTAEYKQIKEELKEFGMLVFDPLLQFNGCDENSNTHAGVLMGALKDWAGEEDKAIILLHHVTIYENGNIKARGAGEWQNGCRCVYSIAFPMKTVSGQAVPDKASQNRVFELIKDNGIGYKHFTNSNGVKEKTLRVFPDENTSEGQIKIPF
jgi:replicative DNA helicase